MPTPSPLSQAHPHTPGNQSLGLVWGSTKQDSEPWAEEVRGPLGKPRKELSLPQSHVPYLNICDLRAGAGFRDPMGRTATTTTQMAVPKGLDSSRKDQGLQLCEALCYPGQSKQPPPPAAGRRSLSTPLRVQVPRNYSAQTLSSP